MKTKKTTKPKRTPAKSKPVVRRPIDETTFEPLAIDKHEQITLAGRPFVARRCVTEAKAAIIKQIELFIEQCAERCDGFQSAVRFRDFVEIEFKRHCKVPISKSIVEN